MNAFFNIFTKKSLHCRQYQHRRHLSINAIALPYDEKLHLYKG